MALRQGRCAYVTRRTKSSKPVVLGLIAVVAVAATLGIGYAVSSYALTSSEDRLDAQRTAGALEARAASQAPSRVIAVVDGVEVTDADLAEQIARLEGSRAYLLAEIAHEEEGAPNAQALLDLLNAYDLQSIAFIEAVLRAAIQAEVQARGLTPSDAEVTALVDQSVALHREAQAGNIPLDPSSEARVEGMLEVVDEDYFLNVLMPKSAIEQLGERNLVEAVVGLDRSDAVRDEWTQYTRQLVHNADIQILAPDLEVDIQQSLDYFDRAVQMALEN